MREGNGIEALSALGWWQLAGVDTLVDDAPRDWLTAPAKPAAAIQPTPEAAAPAALPETLEAMRAFLASDPSLGDGPRLAPEGDPASGLMLLVDMPEAGDAEAGQLLSGPAGLLLDRMLAAIGRDRASAYLAPITPARPAGGRIAPETAAAHARIALAHAALAAPRVLLLIGDGASRAVLGTEVARARGCLHALNLGGASMAAIATFHPRLLLQQPARKADAWADLRLVLGGLAQ